MDRVQRIVNRLHRSACESSISQSWPARPGQEQYEWEEPRVVDHSMLGRHRISKEEIRAGRNSVEQAVGREIKSELGGTDDGTSSRVDPIANRVDRLRLLGNGVVPQVAERAIRVLLRKLHDAE